MLFTYQQVIEVIFSLLKVLQYLSLVNFAFSSTHSVSLFPLENTSADEKMTKLGLEILVFVVIPHITFVGKVIEMADDSISNSNNHNYFSSGIFVHKWFEFLKNVVL